MFSISSSSSSDEVGSSGCARTCNTNSRRRLGLGIEPLRNPGIRLRHRLNSLHGNGCDEGDAAVQLQENTNVSHTNADRETSAVPVPVPATDSIISNFLRNKTNSDDAPVKAQLQTSILTYKPTSHMDPTVQVDLVPTIHSAERRYYEFLQERLERYDCVLYELIKSKDNEMDIKQQMQKIIEAEPD